MEVRDWLQESSLGPGIGAEADTYLARRQKADLPAGLRIRDIHCRNYCHTLTEIVSLKESTLRNGHEL